MQALPPKAPLVFRVGVVGHRPDRLTNASLDILSGVMRTVLQVVKDAVSDVRDFQPGTFSSAAPILRAISPLAEGSDRLFARAAIDLGFELCCPFPFAVDEYKRDFASGKALEQNSLAHFEEIQDDAKARTALRSFELDGDPAHRPAAYGTCGEVVLNQSDVLVVVWDHDRHGKKGGTEATFDLAARKGVPIVVIDANTPHAWTMHDQPDRGAADLRRTVLELLRLPLADATEGAGLRRFYRNGPPRWRFSTRIVWRIFLAVFGFEWWWKRGEKKEVPPPRPNALVRYSEWTDRLASHFANAYRSAFVVIYALAVVAVALTIVPFARGWQIAGAGDRELLAAVLEVVTISSMLFVWIRGNLRHWHDRWLDYRLAAELIRHLELAAPLGSERPFPPPSAHLAEYGQPSATWAAWYVRAIERERGLPDTVADQPYLLSRVRELYRVLDEQIAYHNENGPRAHRIEKRLDRVGLGSLIATLLAAGVHGFGLHVPFVSGGVLIFIGGVFPAIGASLAGINNQGEFRRIAKRSHAMAANLADLRKELDGVLKAHCDGQPLQWVKVAELTRRTSQLMVSEVLDWRVVFLDRPLIPGA